MLKILNEGLCTLVSVRPAYAPAKAEIVTSLGEVYPVFVEWLVEKAKRLCLNQATVQLKVRQSQGGKYYVSDLQPVDFSVPIVPCLRCVQYAKRIAVDLFECPSCHYQMRKQPTVPNPLVQL